MKTPVPNLLINQANNALLFAKNTQTMLQKLLLSVLIFAGYTVNISAQENRASNPVMHVDQFLAASRLENQNNISGTPAESLLKNVQHAVYVMDGQVKTYGTNPVCLYTDAVSMNAMQLSAIQAGNIEMVTINVKASDLASGIDLAVFSGLPNLKYIYILSDKDATADAIIGSIQNNNPAYRVFYEIVNNS